MSEFLPKEVREGLRAAQRLAERKKSRLSVEVGGQRFKVLRKWDGGFAVEEGDAPRLRGLVDLYDGARHVSQCLIVTARAEDGEWLYDFKRSTPPANERPLDFERDEAAPVGLLPRH